MIEIPIWEKSNLTIEEASAYFNVGINKLRELVQDECYDCIIKIGNKTIIKKNKMQEFMDSVSSL